MNLLVPKINKKELNLLIHLLCSFILTMYLFYLDEGYHNFKWMSEPGNWVAFLIYSSFFMLIQFLVRRYFFKNSNKYTDTIFWSLMICLVILIIMIAIFSNQ